MMLVPCPACGSFSLTSTDMNFDDADSVLNSQSPQHVHLECSRCHWMGSGDTMVQNNRPTLTNVGHDAHVFW